MRSTTRSLFRSARLAALVIFCAAMPQRASAAGALVTYFNFNDGNEISDAPGIQVSTITQNNVTASFVAGTIVNQTLPSPYVDPTGAGSALRLTNNNNGNGNPKTFQFSVSTVGLSNLSLSYATQASIANYTQTLFYSVDGGATFLAAGPNNTFTPTTQFTVANFDLSGVTAINNQTNVIFQIGLTQNGGLKGDFNDFDNIQLFAAVAVPEPGTMAGGTLALAALGYMQRRRLRSVFRTRWKKAA